jgi:hypothetical protein
MQKAPQQTQSSEEQPIFGTNLNDDDTDVFSINYKGILPRLSLDSKPGDVVLNTDTSVDSAGSHTQIAKSKLLLA